MRAVTNSFTALVAGLLALTSCQEPLVYGEFMRSSERSASGRYVFSLPLTDSLRTYDLMLYTRITASSTDLAQMPDSVRYQVVLKSPSDIYYKASAAFSKYSYSGSSSFSKSYMIPLRYGFKPVEYGDWTLYVSLPGEESLCLDGLGYKLSKK